jgi:Rad3-related DNA helicase
MDSLGSGAHPSLEERIDWYRSYVDQQVGGVSRRALKALRPLAELANATDRLRSLGEMLVPETGERSPLGWVQRLRFIPVDVGPLLAAHLWVRGAKTLLMSAAVGDPGAFTRSAGKDEFEGFAMPSPIPAGRRPIVYRPVADVVTGVLVPAAIRIAAEVDALIRQYPDQKGIVHTVSSDCPTRVSPHCRA